MKPCDLLYPVSECFNIYDVALVNGKSYEQARRLLQREVERGHVESIQTFRIRGKAMRFRLVTDIPHQRAA